MWGSTGKSDRSIIFFRVLFLIMLSLVGIRLFQLQIVRGGNYEARAEIQHRFTREDPARRGNILDRNNRLLAGTMATQSVWLYKPVMSPDDIVRAVVTLSSVLGGSTADFMKKINEGPSYVRVARHVDLRSAKKIEEARINGLELSYDPLRFYPNGSAASQLLGFCNRDGQGVEGVERQFDKYLKGQDGFFVFSRDALNKPISTTSDSRVEPRPGLDLILTIDVWIQSILEEEMAAACEKFVPSGAVGMVVDVKTGDVLAMSSWPSFDPNKYNLYPIKSFRNRAVRDIYEPGSMAKMFTAAAALERGIMSPDTVIDCENGRYYLHGRMIKDAGNHHYNELTLTQVIAKSSNVGTAKIGEAVGAEGLYDTLCAFGLNEMSGLSLLGEEKSWLYPVSKWSKKSVASISFGYELCVTPAAICRAYCAVANGGILPPLRVIEGVYDNQGRRVFSPESGEPRRAISKETSDKLIKILREVVMDGTCSAANIPEYRIAGKTGTAIKVVNGKYDWSKTLSSFIGFAPLSDPRLVVLISLDEPTKAQYGGTVAGPAVTGVLKRSLEYLGVPFEK
ncbi:MAG: penicillin-binding protein 2 [Planctomycetota bacterium]